MDEAELNSRAGVKHLLQQMMRFGAVGVLNTAVGLAVIWLSMLLGVTPLVANAIGYGVGLVVSFNLNRSWTFRAGDAATKPSRDAVRFLSAFAVAWGLNILVLWTALRITEISPYLLQIAGMMTYTVVFFILCRIWVFAPAGGRGAASRL